MTDRELLEKAAKAAGLMTDGWHRDGGIAAWLPGQTSKFWFSWNPLADDGGALRLAVKLGLQIRHYPIFEPEKFAVLVVRRTWNADAEKDISRDQMLHYLGDPCAATRRAIVRAAAELADAAGAA